jgi:hypothetical protein
MFERAYRNGMWHVHKLFLVSLRIAYRPVWIDLFWAHAKQLMQINKLLCIVHKVVNVVYEKTAYANTIFASENLWININAYLFV